MDQIAIQDWPGPPIDSSTDSNNSWMPAYGYQTPSALLEKEDFIGTSDAEYFLHGTAGQYMYLETIQEETSDDLRSESDAESRDSPLRWLATDSEDGSVICIDRVMDDAECESDREIACPPKRRKQDSFLSLSGNEDYDEGSISRSSSLLQFETLEKQCQQDSQSPSLFTHFSFESLNGIQETKEFCSEYDRDIFTHFGDEITRSKQSGSRDSLLYNASTRYSSSDSGESDITVENSRSCDNLKTWKSLDNLLLSGSNNGPKKFSSENLSEDSGYGDQLLISSLNNGGQGQIQLNVSGSATNLEESSKGEREGMDSKSSGEAESKEIRNEAAGFGAYDCEVYQNFNSNFGVSYQDLSIFDRYDPFNEPLSKSSPLTDVFLRKKHARQLLNANFSGQTHSTNGGIIIDPENSYSKSSKFSDGGVPHAASVPNLLPSTERSPVDIQDSVVNVSSVPKDLNFVGKLNNGSASASVAEKDWNLADLSLSTNKSEHLGANNVSTRKEKVAKKLDSDKMAASYKREGSYDKAMSNRVDLSDDEDSLRYRKTLPKSPIVDFDRTVLKAISEQSLQSLLGSTASLLGSQKHLVQQDICQERSAFCTSTPTRKYENKSVAMSTPDLNWIDPVPTRDKVVYLDDDRRKSTQEISASKYDTGRLEEERRKSILLDCSNDEAEMDLQRKGSIIKSSTSTSGMSDIEDKTLRHSVKSFTGSNGSKGVHFSPVVAEVNWHDDASTSTVTPDRESIYSFNSSSPEPRSAPFRASNVVRPKPQYPPSRARRSVSQPDISDNESKIYKREFIDSLHKLRKEEDMSKSQPDVSKLKRRGSQLVKKDRDGCTVKAYTLDGVQYQHTHLDLKSLSHSSLIGSNPALNKPGGLGGGAEPVSKTNLTSKFPFYGPDEDGSPTDAKPATVKQSSTGAMAGRCNNAIGDDVPYSKRKNKSGLGGFLQRLASFRLGVKKGQERKEKLQTKKTQENIAGAPVQSANQKNPNFSNTNQKPNYIYIPLKAPSSTPENNNTNVVDGPGYAAKPPLPKQPPPRVVHASVKKTHALNGGVGSEYERRRRRTIDSVEIRDARHHHGNASMDGPMGLIETDLDTEVTVITNGANAKARSLLDLGPEPRLQVPQNANGTQNNSGRPHKSMEFLLDKQNLKVVEPPENELQKTERVMSEHELRIQRSLQKLTVPDWYKNSQIPAQGFLLKKSRETRWAGTGSKTTSLSSLGSGVQSPLVLSPTPSSQPFVRWSTSKLNSTASSPCQSTRSSFNQGRQPNGSISPSSARSSFNYRQPYLGWRSQERLNRPRTPAERLASTLLSNQGSRATQQENPEIQTSIKEVTSAIVHYVSGLRPAADDGLENGGRRSSSVSPRGSQKLCWLESSFVGTKPLDSPETPVTCSESPVPPHSLRLDLQNHSSNDLTTELSAGDTRVRPSPSSTTLEDVLDSLLGLPPSGRSASPCLQETVSASTSPQRRSSDDVTNGAYRRRSEGSEPASVNADPALPTPTLLRCRYSRCAKTALPMSKEAKSFKNCHNCSYTYCSRACRRSHWERHRKTCLFSRMGTLCRQVVQAVRDQKDTLKELSKVARRGYISHGLGAVKCFYPNPEAAEKFLAEGLPSLGELTFVRWQDLLPTEMGPMLYKELVEMCQNYNGETKFVLYISLCVVSETPASGAVKWERQLVSRCAKLRLSKDLNFVGPERETETPETLILTCPPIRLPTPETRMRARLIAFNTLQSQLKVRGVSIKRQYPELYKQLDAYCEDLSVKFEAQTIYPRNGISNKSFMCIIMLESDPETLKHVEKAGVKVRTIDCLLSSETTTTL